MPATIYLIPAILAEDRIEPIPSYIIAAVKECSVFFVENERTTRRYFKLLWKEMVIDNYEWHNMKEVTDSVAETFKQKIKEEKTIGIVSEAGCPGIADPGQQLVDIAQRMNVTVKPLVGPSSILLALMGSGMNGQQFRFSGYLPIDNGERMYWIKQLESESAKKNCTEIFIETPYRNNQLMEMIKTKTVQEWKSKLPDMHKRPAIFLIYAGS
jgi:16S rRNA (cytidine1402-2'-O)-methyltransferase